MASSPIPISAPDVRLVLQTPRLELVAATLALIEAEVAGAEHLAALLKAEVETWPPPGNDENSLRWTLEKLQAHPKNAAFHVWYVILAEQERRTLIRIGGFQRASG